MIDPIRKQDGALFLSTGQKFQRDFIDVAFDENSFHIFDRFSSSLSLLLLHPFNLRLHESHSVPSMINEW
jgi:hypothetical protein